ncbi:MAG: hypothetical protein JWN79_49 [Gemmatimonadetes bacterium]|jgi:hypothetical protein|nr:hypothetical protein [Gemmatimonadota bacterium]
MERHDHAPVIVTRADDLLRLTTRRSFLRAIGAGASIVLLPGVFAACDDSSNDLTGVGGLPEGSLAFDLRTDVGIFRLTQTQEIIESTFYSAVVTHGAFNTFFTADERELFTDLRNVELVHREFLRNALGAQAVPDFSGQLNQTTLAQLLVSRDSIIATARMLEHTGLATLNGAGKYIRDARNLLVSGKLASVEARHAAALRDFGPPAGIAANTAFAGDDVIDVNGRDVKIEASVTVASIRALNIINEPLNSNVTITNPPDATQGVPTADFFPANP